MFQYVLCQGDAGEESFIEKTVFGLQLGWRTLQEAESTFPSQEGPR